MSKLLPVVHVDNLEQTIRNVLIAKNCGCDGCFLINHDGGVEDLISAYTEVRKEVGDWWLGINDLTNSFKIYSNLNAVWYDNLGIDEDKDEQTEAKYIWGKKQDELIFGGIAFKYQKEVYDLSLVAKLAVDFCDVVTTSGDQTGQPPTIEKIKTIKEAIGDKPLAIASGITSENVKDFKQYTEYFLVSTGISKSFFEFDQNKMEKLLFLIKS